MEKGEIIPTTSNFSFCATIVSTLYSICIPSFIDSFNAFTKMFSKLTAANYLYVGNVSKLLDVVFVSENNLLTRFMSNHGFVLVLM